MQRCTLPPARRILQLSCAHNIAGRIRSCSIARKPFSAHQRRHLSCWAVAEADESVALELAADEYDDRDRRKPRKAATPTTLLQSAKAATAGNLPEVLAATFPQTFPTLSAARRVIRKDLILIDGQIGSCKSTVTPGQELQQLEPLQKHKPPRTVSLEVAYEDDHLALVHKPWGVKMYGGDARRTVTGALRAGALQPSPLGDALQECKPVHRLDAAVGGLLVVAKTASALASLSGQFEGRRVHKVYHALLAGRLEPAAVEAAVAHARQQQQQQQGLQQALTSAEAMSSADDSGDDLTGADLPQQEVTHEQAAATDEERLREPPQQQQEMSLHELLLLQLQSRPAFSVSAADIGDPSLIPALPAATGKCSGSSSSSLGLSPDVHVVDLPLNGKDCYSLLQVLGHSRAGRFGGWLTSVALSPMTGRKHQLRQHMAALGHPIVGDGLYNNDKAEHISNQGIYLESLEVSFAHPETAQPLHISIPEPARFTALRQQQDRRWSKLQRQQEMQQPDHQAEELQN